ncbi:conserved Plasmodium protein, unknown function [Plasmodium ovale wallikeri]|uniref:Uncharacterized protein n=1 Tax=Plasmodium ovale wallikeri TaxID=864142 RepID=A0A1A8YGW7_PLAOA|nr:conserved Plasmodium protein, unknown function [Plasmodium ovale wallikeri]
MEGSLEVIGEGNKMIVFRKKGEEEEEEEGEEGEEEGEEEKKKITGDYSKVFCKKFNIANYKLSIYNSFIFSSYIDLLKHINLFSYIFFKNTVIKVAKENKINSLNVIFQYYWLKELTYNKVQIFDDYFLAKNNFVVFNSYFTDFVKHLLCQCHYSGKTKMSMAESSERLVATAAMNAHILGTNLVENAHVFATYTVENAHVFATYTVENAHVFATYLVENAHIFATYTVENALVLAAYLLEIANVMATHLMENAQLIATNMMENAQKWVTYTAKNAHVIRQNILDDIKSFLYIVSNKENIASVKRHAVNYLRSAKRKEIPQQVIIILNDCIRRLERKNKIRKNKSIFKMIYNSHNFVYNHTSERNNFVGCVEENLFFIPYYLHNGKNYKNSEHNTHIGIKEDCTNGNWGKIYPSFPPGGGSMDDTAGKFFRHTGNGKKMQCNVVPPCEDWNDGKKIPFTYISIELKLKCGVADYKNMCDKYNVQQVIKLKNRKVNHLSLYVPSTFFNLNFWDIFNNLNYIFLYNSNNINMYINNKKYLNTSHQSFNHLSNFFINNISLSLQKRDFSTIDLYFNHLNDNKEENNSSRLCCEAISSPFAYAPSIDGMEKGRGTNFHTFFAHRKAHLRKRKMSRAGRAGRADYRTGVRSNYSDNNANMLHNKYSFLLNKLQLKMSTKGQMNNNIIDYCQKIFIFPENIIYAYKNYIFSNYFYVKYAMCGIRHNFTDVLFSMRRGKYRDSFARLVNIFHGYRNMYYFSLMSTCTNALSLFKERYRVIGEIYLSEKWDTRKGGKKSNPLWDTNLSHNENGVQSKRNSIYTKGNISSCRKVRKRISPCNKSECSENQYYKNECDSATLRNEQLLRAKKWCSALYSVYRNALTKLEGEHITLWSHKWDKKKEIFEKAREKLKKYILCKMKRKLLYTYDTNVKTNYYFNLVITNRLNLAVKAYFQQMQYHLREVFIGLKTLYRQRIYKKSVHETVAFLYNHLYHFVTNKGYTSNHHFEISGSRYTIEGEQMVEAIKSIVCTERKMINNKIPFQISQNVENVAILSKIVQKEKYLFYKLLYFHCFSAGQVQIVHCMLNFIEIFKILLPLKNSEDIFSKFEYYQLSLNDIFCANRNRYIKKNRHLSHLINVKRIMRLSNYLFNKENFSDKEKGIKRKRKRKINIKNNAFIYLQNVHFILGNELLIDAMNYINMLTENQFNYIKTEMKINTRKLYYDLYRSTNRFRRKYAFSSYPYVKKIRISNKGSNISTCRGRDRLIRDILSNNTLVTMEHFDYLTSPSFRNKTSINRILFRKRKRNVPMKAFLIYKSMISFVCRFLISKTFCDNSTIFNIYAREDNKYDDAQTVQFLRMNRFKPLNVNMVSKRVVRRTSTVTTGPAVTPVTNLKDGSPNMENDNEVNYRKNGKMKRKHISRINLSMQPYPMKRVNLQKRKMLYTKKAQKQLKKMIMQTYIPQKNKKVFYRISLIDLSMKSLSKMKYWEKQMEDIISVYRTYCKASSIRNSLLVTMVTMAFGYFKNSSPYWHKHVLIPFNYPLTDFKFYDDETDGGKREKNIKKKKKTHKFLSIEIFLCEVLNCVASNITTWYGCRSERLRGFNIIKPSYRS